MSNLVGYARVSTRDQDYNGQQAELEAAGCTRIYREKESGARTDRPELRKAVARLESGDVLVVCRLDRLARSTRDLLDILAEIAAKGAGFKSLHDSWADTTTPHGRLMLTVLGGLAEFERELIRARTGAGRERAKARGVKFGRPTKLDEFQRREALTRLAAGNPRLTLRGHTGSILPPFAGWRPRLRRRGRQRDRFSLFGAFLPFRGLQRAYAPNMNIPRNATQSQAADSKLSPRAVTNRSRIKRAGDFARRRPALRIARRYRDIVAHIAIDQGGADLCSESRMQLIRRFASGAVFCRRT